MQSQSQKLQLKEQAKSLLLKGCYKMANNKYQRLIELGGEGFSQREWAVINLNKAICLQFLQQPKQALEWIETSIITDPKYQKAYYRRMQILRELGRCQQALETVPSWIINKQIDELRKQIQQEYYNSLGIDQILEDFQSAKQSKLKIKKELLSKFYQRLLQNLQSPQNHSLTVIGQKMAKCYSLLKQNKLNQNLQSFLSVIHLLLVKANDQVLKKPALHNLLTLFWKSYFELAEITTANSIVKQDIKTKQQYKILKFAPNSQLSLQFLKLLVSSEEIIQFQQVFEYTLQLTHLMAQKQILENKGYVIKQSLEILVNKISINISHKLLGWLSHSFLLIDSLIKLHLYFQPQLKLQKVDLVSIFYLKYYYLNRVKDSQYEKSFIKGIKTQEICEFLAGQLQNFVVIYVAQQFLYLLDKKILAPLIPAIEQQLEVLKQLKEISNQSNKSLKNLIKMRKQYQLVYISMMLKIDLKHSTSRINISSLLSYKQNRAQVADQVMSDIAINTVLLLSVSSSKNLIQILSHPHTITEIIHSFTKQPEQNKIEHINITINLIYLVITDLQHLQEVNYAKKMGVSVQEVEKARQMQGEAQKAQIKKEVTHRREKFKEYVAKHSIEALVDLSALLLKVKQESLLAKWGTILTTIASVDASRLHNSIIIEVMLLAFKYQKNQTGSFFSILCKKINSQLLKYEQFQAIADVLLYNIQNAEHELIIFESLLGLINLTSNTNHHLKIPIKPLQNCLLEQNRYIVHGSLELLNNALVYFDKEEICQHQKLIEIVEKYIAFYRQEVIFSEYDVPKSDYSHPQKIYATLLSLAIVMDLQNLPQFKDWSKSEEALMKIETNRSISLFKVALYMHSKQKLKGIWWSNFQQNIKQLEKIDKGRWMKLKQYMK